MFDRDTTAEASAIQARVLRGLTGPQKLKVMNELTLMAHSLVRAGIRERLPDASAAELEREYFRVVLGEALATRVLEYRDRVRSGSAERAQRKRCDY